MILFVVTIAVCGGLIYIILKSNNAFAETNDCNAQCREKIAKSVDAEVKKLSPADKAIVEKFRKALNEGNANKLFDLHSGMLFPGDTDKYIKNDAQRSFWMSVVSYALNYTAYVKCRDAAYAKDHRRDVQGLYCNKVREDLHEKDLRNCGEPPQADEKVTAYLCSRHKKWFYGCK